MGEVGATSSWTAAASDLARTVTRYVLAAHLRDNMLQGQDIAEVAAITRRVRPLAQAAVGRHAGPVPGPARPQRVLLPPVVSRPARPLRGARRPHDRCTAADRSVSR